MVRATHVAGVVLLGATATVVAQFALGKVPERAPVRRFVRNARVLAGGEADV